jgi:LPS sulfotransferase NodH
MKDRVRNPVLIVGCGRSGTTLLRELLGAHRSIAAYPSEANELWHPSTYPWHRATVDVPPIWTNPRQFTDVSLAARPPEHALRLQAHFGAFQALAGRPVLLHKSVMLNFMLPYLLEVFPAARFVHLVRDGRAVALSYATFQRKRATEARARYVRAGFDWPFDALLVQFARYWALTMEELNRQQAARGLAGSGRWLEVRYETLCSEPAAVLATTAEFIGVARDGYGIQRYDHITNRNPHYLGELDPVLRARLTAETGAALAAYGYA